MHTSEAFGGQLHILGGATTPVSQLDSLMEVGLRVGFGEERGESIHVVDLLRNPNHVNEIAPGNAFIIHSLANTTVEHATEASFVLAANGPEPLPKNGVINTVDHWLELVNLRGPANALDEVSRHIDTGRILVRTVWRDINLFIQGASSVHTAEERAAYRQLGIDSFKDAFLSGGWNVIETSGRMATQLAAAPSTVGASTTRRAGAMTAKNPDLVIAQLTASDDIIFPGSDRVAEHPNVPRIPHNGGHDRVFVTPEELLSEVKAAVDQRRAA